MRTDRIHQRYTLNAAERLKLRKQIETLFQSGKAFSIAPLRVLFLLVPRPSDEPSPVRAGFAVPKKRIRKAVDRNKVRRRLKESWRLQKLDLYAEVPQHLQLHVFLIYNGEKEFNFDLAFETVGKAMATLTQKVGKKEVL